MGIRKGTPLGRHGTVRVLLGEQVVPLGAFPTGRWQAGVAQTHTVVLCEVPLWQDGTGFATDLNGRKETNTGNDRLMPPIISHYMCLGLFCVRRYQA